MAASKPVLSDMRLRVWVGAQDLDDREIARQIITKVGIAGFQLGETKVGTRGLSWAGVGWWGAACSPGMGDRQRGRGAGQGLWAATTGTGEEEAGRGQVGWVCQCVRQETAGPPFMLSLCSTPHYPALPRPPQVFLRGGQMAQLDKMRTELLNGAATTIQRYTRGWLARRHYVKLRRWGLACGEQPGAACAQTPTPWVPPSTWEAHPVLTGCSAA